MISDQKLDAYRKSGAMVRVIRDANKENDIIGIVVAWNAETVMIRKRNRKIVKLSRSYTYQPREEEREFDLE